MAQEGNASLAESATQRLDNQLAMIATLATSDRQDSSMLEGTAKAPALDMEQQPSSPVLTLAPPNVITYAGLSNADTVDNKTSELAHLLQQNAVKNSDALHNALATAPEAVKPALLQAISVSEAGYDNALNAISE